MNAGLGGIEREKVEQAEDAVLGSIMIDPEKFFLVSSVFGKHGSKVFFGIKNRKLFEAFRSLVEKNQPIDLVTVTEEMGRDGLDPAEITGLMVAVPSSVYAVHYAEIVLEYFRLREVERIGSELVGRVYKGGEDAAALTSWAEEQILGNSKGEETRTAMGEILAGVLDELEEASNLRKDGLDVGVNLGNRFLDRLLGGLRGGNLLILGARPGMGKTTFALQAARYVAANSGPVWTYTFEMSKDEIGKKHLAAVARCSYTDLHSGVIDDSDWPILLEAANELSSLPLETFEPEGSIEAVRNHAIARAARFGSPALIVVDYIQLMSGNPYGRGEVNRVQDVSVISRGLKLLARRLGCPVVALSQLSRSVESRGDKRPMLSDLRESGSLEQDADAVIFLYREDYYVPDTDLQNVMEAIVAKNRHGSTGVAKMYFEKPTGQIKELELKRTEL